MKSKKLKIAVLVDADNISHSWADAIIEEASSRGKIILRYACGTRKHLGGRWRKKMEKHKFTEKKAPDLENGADILIVREAMDIMLKHPEIDIFCLVSNDNHFARVLQIPRQWNKKVIIMGTGKAAKVLQGDSEFILLKETTVEPLARVSKKAKVIKPLTEFQALLDQAFDIVNQEWVALNTLGKTLKDMDATYKPKAYGSSTLTKLLKKLPKGVVVKDNKVKLKSHKPIASKPLTEFQALLDQAFDIVNQEWVALNTLGKTLKDMDVTYKPKAYGSSTLTKLLKKLPKGVVVKDNKVKLKSHKPIASKPLTEFQALLDQAFDIVNQEWVALNTLGKTLKDIDATYKPQAYGSSTLTKLLKKLPKGVVVKDNRVKLTSWKPLIPKPLTEFQALLDQAFATLNQEWVALNTLGTTLKDIEPTYKSQNYGSSTLTKLLKKLPNIEVKSGKARRKKRKTKKKKSTLKSKKSAKRSVDNGYKEPETFTLLGKRDW